MIEQSHINNGKKPESLAKVPLPPISALCKKKYPPTSQILPNSIILKAVHHTESKVKEDFRKFHLKMYPRSNVYPSFYRVSIRKF